MMFEPHRKHTYGPPRPVRRIALLFYMQITFEPYRKHTYRPPWPFAGIALHFYKQMMFVLHRKHAPPRCVREIPLLLTVIYAEMRNHPSGDIVQ
jgi:hypothetical protein